MNPCPISSPNFQKLQCPIPMANVKRSFKQYLLSRAIVVLLLSLGLYLGCREVYSLRSERILDNIRLRELGEVDYQRNAILLEMQYVVGDLKILDNNHEILNFITTGDDAAKTIVTREFENFAQERKVYDQIRLLNAEGQERIRINYRDGQAWPVAEDSLQNKADRSYFQRGIAMRRNEIYVSRLDLNQEHGRIEQPYRPVLRFASPIFVEGDTPSGLLIVNYLGENVFKYLQSPPGNVEQSQCMLLNTDGYWLHAPNPEDAWGFEFNQSELSFRHRYPDAWDASRDTPRGEMRTEAGWFFWHRLSMRTVAQANEVSILAEIPVNGGPSSEGLNWTIVSFVPWEQFRAQLSGLAGQILAYGVLAETLLISLAMLLAWMRARDEQFLNSLENSRARAEQAVRAKSEFLANMSHEIRTPLTAILGYSDLAALTEDPRQAREHLQVIQRNGRHLLEILNNILDLSKLEADKLQIETRPWNLVEIVEQVAEMMRLRAETRKLVFKVEYCSVLPRQMYLDALRLRQVLINLVGNAIKFTERGSVRIRVRWSADENEEIPHLHLEVRDTGVGMPEEMVRQVGRPFRQADASTTRKFGGTGLGLAISRRLTEAMGGTLDVRSRLGQGSTFELSLPAPTPSDVPCVSAEELRQALPDPEVRRKILIRSLAGRTILLAEDAPDNQTLIRMILERAGATVHLAVDGLAAVNEARSRPFDLILMDMQMPRMDGYDAAHSLREAGFHQPILALTAHSSKSDREECIRAGCNDYLTKPIQPDVLIQTIVEYLGHTDPDDAAAPAATASADHADAATDTANHADAGAGADAPIHSHLLGDPIYREIVQQFVMDLPQRLAALEQAANAAVWDELIRLAHQLKGAGGGYGFDPITENARVLEAAAKAADAEAVRQAIEALRGTIHRCRCDAPAAHA